MHVGIIQIQLLIPGCRSLKEKRGVVRSLKDRARQKFNLAISEVDEQDQWQIAMIGAVTCGTDAQYCDSVLRRFLAFTEEYREAEVSDYDIEILSEEGSS